MIRPAHVLAVLALALAVVRPSATPVASVAPLAAQGDAPRVHWLVFIDDLHLDFRGTGRTRDLLRAVASTLVRETDLVSAASSGPSSLDVRGRPGPATLVETAKRVTGNGLKDDDALRPAAGRVDEVAYRTRTALTAAAAFVESAGPAPADERRVLLYLSRGYDLERPTGPDEVGTVALGLLDLAAARANAFIVALEPERAPVDASIAVQPPIAATIRARRDTLERLVTPSQGFAAVDVAASRPALLARIAALVGR